jgi:heme-degrading monooxygenase HmoA
MMVVVFRAHQTAAGLGGEYAEQLQRMTDLAVKMPGYVSHKAFVAEDGERLTLIEWDSAERLRAWATHPEHVLVKQLGRQKFYQDYRLQVCEVVRESRFGLRAEPFVRAGNRAKEGVEAEMDEEEARLSRSTSSAQFESR